MSGLVGQIGARSGIVGSTTDSTQLDYEQGTWDAVVKIGNTTQSLINQSCYYTMIGDLIHAHGSVRFNESGSGAISISLPFNPHGEITVGGGYWIDNGTNQNNHTGIVYPVPSSQIIHLVRHGEVNRNNILIYMENGEFYSGRYVYFGITYRKA